MCREWTLAPLAFYITHTHAHTVVHKHTGSTQKYLEPICTNDSLCLMHFAEDKVGYLFGRREEVGDKGLPYCLPFACYSWQIFHKQTWPALGMTVMPFIASKVSQVFSENILSCKTSVCTMSGSARITQRIAN